jgi:hypothetical protein
MQQIWQVLALAAARQGDWREAIRYAERCPSSPEMAQVRAVALLALADAAQARTFLGSEASALVQAPQLEALRELARSGGGAVA